MSLTSMHPQELGRCGGHWGIPPPCAPTLLCASLSTPPICAAAPTALLCVSPPREMETGGEGATGFPPCDLALSRVGPHQAATSGRHGAPRPHGFPQSFPMYLPTQGDRHRGGGHREAVAATISPYTSQPPSPHHAWPPSTIPFCAAAPTVPLHVSPPREMKERREGAVTAPLPP